VTAEERQERYHQACIDYSQGKISRHELRALDPYADATMSVARRMARERVRETIREHRGSAGVLSAAEYVRAFEERREQRRDRAAGIAVALTVVFILVVSALAVL
jgi:hypothetical protein